jgi:hypothetical protein
MSTEEAIAKFKRERIEKLASMDITDVCKTALADPDENVLMIDEGEFTALVTKAAQKQFPNLRSDAAFAKLFSEQSERGTLLRKACAVVKGTATLAPSVSGGLGEERAAINSTEQSEAYNQLMALADKQRAARNITPAMAFAEALADPANRELAAKALARPVATTSYPFPR